MTLKISDTIEIEKAIKSVLQGKAYTCPRFESIRQKLNHASCDIHPKDVPTRRELEVLQAVSEGLSTAEIGLRLDITENTVETFRRRLIQKCNRPGCESYGTRLDKSRIICFNYRLSRFSVMYISKLSFTFDPVIEITLF